jgi:hypothetical protein
MSDTELLTLPWKGDGQVWRPMGAGVDSTVRALAVYNGQLVAAGRFTHAGGIEANRVAYWNGSVWPPFGSGIGDSAADGVNALAAYGGQLIAAGSFHAPAQNIAVWNGSGWGDVSGGADARVNALAVYNSELYAAGDFLYAGGVYAPSIGRWNGASWHDCIAGDGSQANAPQSEVYSLCPYQGLLYVGIKAYRHGTVRAGAIPA